MKSEKKIKNMEPTSQKIPTNNVKPKKIRRGQTITPFGVGAIMEIEGEAFVCEDISKWNNAYLEPVKLERLEILLRKRLKTPKASTSKYIKDKACAVYRRFPSSLFCNSCGAMTRWSYQKENQLQGKKPRCFSSGCKGSLIPMRFVRVCKNGHLDDVDWFNWAHKHAAVANNGQCDRKASTLYFETSAKSGGDWNSMVIRCGKKKGGKYANGCGAHSTLEGLVDQKQKCSGRQPWTKWEEDEQCAEKMNVVPRGGSNVYYPVTISALDISSRAEDNTEKKQRLLNHEVFSTLLSAYKLFKSLNNSKLIEETIKDSPILDDVGVAPEEVIQALEEQCDTDSKEATENTTDEQIQNTEMQQQIKIDEWPALSSPNSVNAKNFVSEVLHLEKNYFKDLRQLIPRVSRIKRLREVRVLRGFQRLSGETDNIVPVDLGTGKHWLPATEVFGEGLFFYFDPEALKKWEKEQKEVINRRIGAVLAHAQGLSPSFLRTTPSARFIALHTLSHMILRQLTYDSGYSSSSLKERVYCDGEDGNIAGILIYTADADSEGSLGGLARLGKAKWIKHEIYRAYNAARWCSADPVCSEIQQGQRGLNMGACHACCLLPETSCDYSNILLDRQLVIGDGLEGRPLGLLTQYITEDL